MSGARLLFITGSRRRRSANTAALHTARAILGGDSAEVYDALEELPTFVSAAGNRRRQPSTVLSLRRAIVASDVVVFCTPVYAGRLPDSLVNLLQWASGPALRQKPATWIDIAGPGWIDDAGAPLGHALRRAGARVLSPRGVSVPVAAQTIGADGLIADPLTIGALAAALDTIVAELPRPTHRDRFDRLQHIG